MVSETDKVIVAVRAYPGGLFIPQVSSLMIEKKTGRATYSFNNGDMAGILRLAPRFGRVIEGHSRRSCTPACGKQHKLGPNRRPHVVMETAHTNCDGHGGNFRGRIIQQHRKYSK
jgi:hypothetical protein